MNLRADSQWREDDTIRADKVFVGMARDHETRDGLGVVIALSVASDSQQVQVSAVMSVEDALGLADAIRLTVMDMELES